MRFNEYPRKAWEEILPGVQDEERDLVSKLVVYESGDRITADEVCDRLDEIALHADLSYRRCSILTSTRHKRGWPSYRDLTDIT
jgi:hypothetical protein